MVLAAVVLAGLVLASCSSAEVVRAGAPKVAQDGEARCTSPGRDADGELLSAVRRADALGRRYEQLWPGPAELETAAGHPDYGTDGGPQGPDDVVALYEDVAVVRIVHETPALLSPSDAAGGRIARPADVTARFGEAPRHVDPRAGGNRPERVVTFEVERLVKGTLPACVAFAVPGGQAGGLGWMDDGDEPLPPVGARAVLFGSSTSAGSVIRVRPDGTFPLQGATLDAATWQPSAAAMAPPPPLVDQPDGPADPTLAVEAQPPEKQP